MTYSDNIEKLRQAGVIDMNLSFGCLCENEEHGVYYFIDQYSDDHRRSTEDDNILGHSLSYGRACRWIEEKYKKSFGIEKIRNNIKKKLDKKRKRKDLPLDDQENREEIAEFLVSLIK